MKSWSQNNEQQIVDGYFGQFVGTLLSIGENTGLHLSNCKALLDKGWSGILVEPSTKAFQSLFARHGNDDPKVWCFNVAISDFDGTSDFYESGEHLGDGDVALLSTIRYSETKRWAGSATTFEKKQCHVWSVRTLLEQSDAVRGFSTFDFINIDAEGEDMTILRQMDLDQLECKCLVIEHNSLPAVVANIREYVIPFGFKEIGYNAENIILAR
jgi:FkbM family methyltransferase